MSIVRYHEFLPSSHEGKQVLQLVEENITDLSMLAVPASNPLYQVYQWTLPVEIGSYMGRIGKVPGQPVEILLAFNDAAPDVVDGFLLYSPVPTHPEACGVNYMAVRGSSRRRGIGSELVRALLNLYPHTELTCAIKRVPFYQSLGFKVIDNHHTHVVMNTYPASCVGQMAVLDVTAIHESREAAAIHNGLVQKWGVKEMKKAEKQLERHVAQLCRQAESFAQIHKDTSV
ncbi:GNAT superfamily N-acetyltransferase [Pseudomonas oryzihabitans]